MDQLYFDTSSILSYWIAVENYHEPISGIFSSISDPETSGKKRTSKYTFTAIVSGLVLTEIASVVERQLIKFTLSSKIDLSKEYIRSVLKLPNIKLVDPIINDKNSLLTYPMYTEAIQLAPSLKLKSLDNLHLGIVSLLTRTGQHQISHFVTGDKEVLDNGKLIHSEIGIRVVDPEQILELLK